MSKEQRKNQAIKLHNLLDFNRQIVGVKFFYEEEAYQECPAQQIIYKMPYCMTVRSASAGHDIKVREDNLGCGAAARVLGMTEVSESYRSGADSMKLRMYHDQGAAKKAVDGISINEKCPCGVEISAIDLMEEDPDVVIIVTNPYNMMRLVQGYSYHFGTYDHYKMAGNQAMCAEITSCTYVTDDVNISLMCSGTRFLNAWERDELAIGIPYGKFEKVIDGVYQTADPLERDGDKIRILKAFEDDGMEKPEFVMGQNYDTDHYRVGKSGIR